MYGPEQDKGKRKMTADGGELHGDTWFFRETPDPNDEPKNDQKDKKKDKPKTTHPSKSQQQKPTPSKTNSKVNVSSSKSQLQQQSTTKLNVTSSKSQVQSHKHKHKKCPKKPKNDGNAKPSQSQSKTQIKNNSKHVNYNPKLVESKSYTSLKSGAGGGPRNKPSPFKSYTSINSGPGGGHRKGGPNNRPTSSKSNLQGNQNKDKSKNGPNNGPSSSKSFTSVQSEGGPKKGGPNNRPLSSKSNLQGNQNKERSKNYPSNSNAPSNTDLGSKLDSKSKNNQEGTNYDNESGQNMDRPRGNSRSKANLQSEPRNGQQETSKDNQRGQNMGRSKGNSKSKENLKLESRNGKQGINKDNQSGRNMGMSQSNSKSNLQTESRNGQQGTNYDNESGQNMDRPQGNSRSKANLQSEPRNGQQETSKDNQRGQNMGRSKGNSKSNLQTESRNGQRGTNQKGRNMGKSQGNSRSNLQSRSQSQMSMKTKKTKRNYSQSLSQSRMTTQTPSTVSQYSEMTRMTGGEYDESTGVNDQCGEPPAELGNRLTVHQKTKIDEIKDSIPKPEGYLPPRYLPTWEDMPIEQRLPLLPAPPGVLFFTRGQLGKTILRKNVIYSMDDPLNRVRVPSDKYEELHDPQNKLDRSVIARPYLLNSGTVNEYGEVICTQKEFNRYRRYLATLYSEQIREKLKDLDDLKKMEEEHKRELIKEEMLTKGCGRKAIREEKVAYAKEFIRMREEQKMRRFLVKQRIEERRCIELQQEKREYQAFLVHLNKNRKKMQMKRMKEQNQNEEDKARIVLHDYTLREMRAAANKQHVDKNRKIIKEQKDACWFDAKILSAAERLERENEIRAEYSETLRKRAVRRQKNVEKFREELPLRIAKNKEAAERLDRIVRKYFYRWWDKVRARLNRKVDEDHESVFYSQKRDVLKDGVDFLYKESGYEKLDDVVMNILKFKEALKRQLSTMEDETLDEETDDETEFYDEDENDNEDDNVDDDDE